MAKTVEAWDDKDYAQGIRTPADHRDVEFKIGGVVAGTFDLTDEHLKQLVEHNAEWIRLLTTVPPEVAAVAAGHRHRRAPVGESPGNADARRYWRDIRDFLQATGRGDQVIRPGWEPKDGSKNKYAHPTQAVLDEFTAWDAAGRPTPSLWRWPQAS
jgi:hypothetical protein